MKKGFLLLTVLTAWLVVKNYPSMHVLTNKNNNLNKKAVLLAHEIKNHLRPFTTVHLSGIKTKTNSCKQTIKTRPLQACRETQRINHETLLTINSL
ncbi:hypothetical protein ESA94_19930 [Lacibacter luteus]|uniref:Uncharacterized protein n=1 Tax=Lacibacter luteus TaxID=2508719 RepID=A0A4Q1CEC4_9BACT|nr:hypothetical protein [Lacibacter luteus]RXK57791.1 hypothetical protein ESA94_19930 [Lacibacter luteus]